MNKLIKLTDDHYVIVDNLEITQACYVYKNHENVHGRGIFYLPPDTDFVAFNKEAKDISVITHSTRPFGGNATAISLQEVKELIGEVDVEKKAEKYTSHDMFWYKQGYNQALEDNKEKKYTEEQMKDLYLGTLQNVGTSIKQSDMPTWEQVLQSLQPKTEWEVEIVDGKLKLK